MLGCTRKPTRSRADAAQHRPNLAAPHPPLPCDSPPLTGHVSTHRSLPLEHPARLWRASVATRFPPAPRNTRCLLEDPHRNRGIHDDRQRTAVHHCHLAGLRILAPRPVEVHGRLQSGLVSRLRNNDFDLPRGPLREPFWCCSRHRPPLLPQEYWAQTLAPRQAIQRQPCGHARSRERGRFQLVSRDAFSYDPQDAGDVRDTSKRASVRPRRSAPPDTRESRNPAPEAPGRSDSVGPREQHPTRDERSDSPRAYYVRDRAYLLRDSQVHSLREIGKFRVIAVPDLAKFAYGGNRERVEKDIRGLARQSLVTDKTVEISQKKTLRVVTLTKAGHRLLKNTNQVPDDQPIYHGLVKPREVKHDADLYRLYQKEVARIERGGGRPVRILLDYELKRNLKRDLAQRGPEKDNLDRKGEVAEKLGMQHVDGKMPVPDLRVEYETPELELRHVDLELATRDYRPRAMAEKAAAGFSLYGPSEDASRLRRVLDEREITAAILTL